MSLYSTPPFADKTEDERRIRHAQLMYLMGIGGPTTPPVVPVDPRIIFNAPLTNSLIPTTAGNPTFTFSRATSAAYVADNEGVLRLAQFNEARFHGARRVWNYFTKSEGGVIANSGSTPPTSSVGTYDGKTNANIVNLPAGVAGSAACLANMYPNVNVSPNTIQGDYRFTSYLALSRPLIDAESIQIYLGGNFATALINLTASVQPGTSFVRFSNQVPVSHGGFNNIAPGIFPLTALASPITIYLWGYQLERVSGQSNQAPGEYVSNGVLSAPYHGNAINGVKYFATTNGNSVTGNVVTEAAGVAIPL